MRRSLMLGAATLALVLAALLSGREPFDAPGTAAPPGSTRAGSSASEGPAPAGAAFDPELDGPHESERSEAPSDRPSELQRECMGCHTANRETPKSRFAVGLGVWDEGQCFGCHAEIDGIARDARAGQRGRGFASVPVSFDRLMQMSTRPLPYLKAPERIRFVVDDIQRIAPERLGAFLRRPATGGSSAEHPDWMMAFPALRDDEAEAILTAMGGNGGARRHVARAGKTEALRLWKSICVSCHDTSAGAAGRTPAYLSLFTADWIFGYVNSSSHSSTGREQRQMPVFAIDREAAQGLYELFGEERRRREERLDGPVRGLGGGQADDPPGGKLSRAAIDYIWGRALRDGACVHCHTGDTRARRHFEATPEGLRAYVGRNGGLALWKRLETRVLEEQEGLVAAAPGMPMTARPLPAQMRALILKWVKSGCLDADGRRACQN